MKWYRFRFTLDCSHEFEGETEEAAREEGNKFISTVLDEGELPFGVAIDAGNLGDLLSFYETEDDQQEEDELQEESEE